jgi:choline dehydrogenase-like flavoprotein
VPYSTQLNSFITLGFGPVSINRREGKRLLASFSYDLSGVEVLTETLVKRVIIEDRNRKKTAVGAELASGDLIKATKEVVVCGGAYRTPQVLMLSGIGPNEELQAAGIEQLVDLPEVGKNLHNHIAIQQWSASSCLPQNIMNL